MIKRNKEYDDELTASTLHNEIQNFYDQQTYARQKHEVYQFQVIHAILSHPFKKSSGAQIV